MKAKAPNPGKKKDAKKAKPEEDAKVQKTNYELIIRQNLSEPKLSFGKLSFDLANPPDKKTIAFTKLKLKGNKLPKKIESLGSSFAQFKLLRDIDLSSNSIADFGTCK